MLICLLCVQCQSEQSSVVSVKERSILVDDSIYTIKGICYHPVPIGSVNERSFEKLSEDLSLMREAGINTIRVYSPIEEEAVLDEIAAAGLKVIIGFGYNQEGHYDIHSGSFIDYVQKYKNHKAILFWELGNEYNYHPEWFGGDLKNWYRAMNQAAEKIHQQDANHPVATAHGELPDSLALATCPNVDIWGMNVYRWDNPETIFAQWSAISNKPMYLSEAGADSYMSIAKDGYAQGVNELAQADATRKIAETTLNNRDICSGLAIFAFVDELWKAGGKDTQDTGGWAPNSSGVPYDGAPNEEYWGIVDINRNKKQAFYVLKDIFTRKRNMTHILKNKNIELHIDLPSENYQFSRFDWTGKIAMVKYKDIRVTGVERTDSVDQNKFGRGLYNEFGIERPIDFDETEREDYFHKIGVGSLKKSEDEYRFSHEYEIQPAEFDFRSSDNKVCITCKSQKRNGYAYELKKEIELFDDHFVVNYHFRNTGSKTISTDEYVHNFLAINEDLIGSQYLLKFPFEIQAGVVGAIVNPEDKVLVGKNEITFRGTPNEQFFYSHLAGNREVAASWELINTKSKIGIRETDSFTTAKVNLWGWTHVVSPELFFELNAKPGELVEWTRTYELFGID